MIASTVNRAVVVFGLAATGLFGAIPEPDAVLYGTAIVNGAAVGQQAAVVLVARLSSGQEIGRYDFADCNADGVLDKCELSCSAPGCSGVPGCGTARDTSPADGSLDDCPGNLYALKVKCESTPPGLTATGLAAVLNPASPTVVKIFMAAAGGPEKLARHLRISERGKIRQIALSALDLFAFRDLAACMGGPGGTSPGGACTAVRFSAADTDDDGDADLRDFELVQNNFVGQ